MMHETLVNVFVHLKIMTGQVQAARISSEASSKGTSSYPCCYFMLFTPLTFILVIEHGIGQGMQHRDPEPALRSSLLGCGGVDCSSSCVPFCMGCCSSLAGAAAIFLTHHDNVIVCVRKPSANGCWTSSALAWRGPSRFCATGHSACSMSWRSCGDRWSCPCCSGALPTRHAPQHLLLHTHNTSSHRYSHVHA